MKPLGLKESARDQRKHYRLAALSEHKRLKVCQTKTSLSLCGPSHTSPDHGEFLLIHFSFVIFSLHSMSSPRIHHLSKYDPQICKVLLSPLLKIRVYRHTPSYFKWLQVRFLDVLTSWTHFQSLVIIQLYHTLRAK